MSFTLSLHLFAKVSRNVGKSFNKKGTSFWMGGVLNWIVEPEAMGVMWMGLTGVGEVSQYPWEFGGTSVCFFWGLTMSWIHSYLWTALPYPLPWTFGYTKVEWWWKLEDSHQLYHFYVSLLLVAMAGHALIWRHKSHELQVQHYLWHPWLVLPMCLWTMCLGHSL